MPTFYVVTALLIFLVLLWSFSRLSNEKKSAKPVHIKTDMDSRARKGKMWNRTPKYSCIRYPKRIKAENNSVSYNYSISMPYNIVVISIGSITRQSLQAAQNETFGRHMSKMFFITEETFPKCTECPRDIDNIFSDRKDIFNKGIEWYCAQQRNLQALKYVINLYKNEDFKQIDWLAIIDDDTYLNPRALVNKLSLFDYKQIDTNATVIGHHEMGGAGFVFNRAALKQLYLPVNITSLAWKDRLHNNINNNNKKTKKLGENENQSQQQQQRYVSDTYTNTIDKVNNSSPAGISNETGFWTRAQVIEQTILDLCIQKQNGGNWCGYHSDWAIGACVKAARINITRFDTMHQVERRCSLSTHISNTMKYNKEWMKNSLISMHYMGPDDMIDQYEYVFGPDTGADKSPDYIHPRGITSELINRAHSYYHSGSYNQSQTTRNQHGLKYVNRSRLQHNHHYQHQQQYKHPNTATHNVVKSNPMTIRNIKRKSGGVGGGVVVGGAHGNRIGNGDSEVAPSP